MHRRFSFPNAIGAFAILLLFTQCMPLEEALAPRRSKTEKPTPDPDIVTTPTGSSERPTGIRQEVIDFAQQFVGTKYRYGGRDPQKGFDCSGFTRYVLGNFEVPLSATSGSQASEGKKVKTNKVQAGDLVFFKRSSGGRVFHVALVIGNDRDGLKVIHSTSRGVVVDNITASSYWAPKLALARDVLD